MRSRAILSLVAMLTLTLAASASAGDAYNTVGLSGYDLVSYQTNEKPLRGNGNHLVVHDGVTYLFASKSNRKAFEKNPEKYLPAFGGYCAYDVSVGKKFVGDPETWEVVDGRLYVNLDNKIKGLWIQDIPGNIEKAESNWPRIRGKSPREL